MKSVFRIFRMHARTLAFAGVAALGGCATAPLSPGDKAVLVTIADLYPTGTALPASFAQFEHHRKTTRVDGGVELEYQFDARATGERYPYIYTTVNHETTVSSAVAAYGATKAGLGLADLDARDDSERFRYGDWSYFGTLVFEDEARGFVFYMRDDLTVYTLMISGYPMDVDAIWEQLVLPRLEILSLNH